MQIVPLTNSHIEPAACLFVGEWQKAQTLAPTLSCPHDAVETIVTRLSDLQRTFPGAAVVQDGNLKAYLIGMALPEFMSARRGIYCPEWAHGAAGEQRPEMYRQMYAFLSPQWADNGCYTHAVTLFSHDTDVLHTWFRNGFGLNGVDAVRDLTPLPVTAASDLEIYRAVPDDTDRLLPLMHDLQRHLASGPVFLPLLELDVREEVKTWLEQPSNALWFAEREGQVIAYVQCQTAQQAQRSVVAGAEGITIGGAYTLPAYRGSGVASRLLDRILRWAREQGLSRCSVDFESQNSEAGRFWLRHFSPVCYSVLRRVDERVAWANGKDHKENSW